MKLTDFQALSFDCYGTLIDWEAGIGSVLRAWADRHGVALSTEELLVAYADNEADAERHHPTDPYPSILARAMRGLGKTLGSRYPMTTRTSWRYRYPTGPRS